VEEGCGGGGSGVPPEPPHRETTRGLSQLGSSLLFRLYHRFLVLYPGT
jgi:hypothetical protein